MVGDVIRFLHQAGHFDERLGRHVLTFETTLPTGAVCMGVIDPVRHSALYIGTLAESLMGGRVALVSQSGSVCEAAVNMGPRVGFSAIVSCGIEAVTTVGDYLEYFAADAQTGAVALFLEGFRDPGGFVAGARLLRSVGKPLAVLQATAACFEPTQASAPPWIIIAPVGSE